MSRPANALLADIVPAHAYGRAYGFERAMDNLGAIVGPLLAIGLVGALGTRWAIGLSVVPGVLAAVAIIYAIRHTAAPRERRREPIRLRIRPVLRGELGRLMLGITAFEVGNCAATLLILRATELFEAGRSEDRATQLAILLYVGYNVAATLISIPAGHHGDRHGATRVLAAGAVCFAAAYIWFAVGPNGVATLAPTEITGSAFGLLAGIQAAGNLAASTIAGVLWTAASPNAAFIFLAIAMGIATPLVVVSTRT